MLFVSSAFRGPFTKPTLVLMSGVLALAFIAGSGILTTFINTKGQAYLFSEAFLTEKKSGTLFLYVIIMAVTVAASAFCTAYAVWVGFVVALYWQKQLLTDLQSVYFKSKVRRQHVGAGAV